MNQHALRWGERSDIAKVSTWLKDKDSSVLVYTPSEWAAREHHDLHANGAVCVVVHDGGEFSRYGSGRAWTAFDKAFPALYQSQLTGWATALFKKEDQ